MSKSHVELLLLSACFCGLFVVYLKIDLYRDNQLDYVWQNEHNKYDAHRQCLLDKIENRQSLWSEFVVYTSNCKRHHLFDLRLHHFRNRDETKFAVIPDNYNNNAGCNIVSFGIGNDIIAELQMHALMPLCLFFGVDPINYRTLYESFGGFYYQTAIDTTSGTFHSTNVSQMEMVDFIANVLNISTIDHLLMDLEGPEWRLLSLFEKNGLLSQNNITVCQLNVEVHGPPERFNGSGIIFATMMKNLLTNSNFLPIITLFEYDMIRQFWMNVNDTYCVEKFLQ